MGAHKLLIVAGDYDVALQIKRALTDQGFELQIAFSHRDALYAVTQDEITVAVVDAAMFDRRTREATIITLAGIENAPTLIAYVSDALSDINARRARAEIVTDLNADSLLARLQRFIKPAAQIRPLNTAPLAAHMQSSTPMPIVVTPDRRDEEVETLLALGRSLTEVLDLSEVLNRVVGAARRLTDADEGMILMPDGDNNELYLRARVGIDQEIARNFRVKTRDTLAGEVFQGGQPALIGASGPLKVKTEYFVNSLLYVPILLKGTTIGVLGVSNKKKDDLFDLRHQELLLNLAAYAAIAIENARVHEESIRRNRELKALVDSSLAINESLSLDVLLPNICDQLLRVIDVHHAEVYQWDRDNQRLISMARAFEKGYSSGTDMPLNSEDHDLLDAMLETKRPVISESSSSTRMFIPIIGGDQVYGLLRAVYTSREQAEQVTKQVGRASRAALELITGLASGVTERHYRQAQEIASSLDAQMLDFALMASANGLPRLVMSVGREALIGTRRSFDLRALPDIMAVIEDDYPLAQRSGSSSLTSGGRVLLESCGCRSLLAIAMVYHGERQGLVVFGDLTEQRQFTARDVELARALIAQASMALANARLLLDLETSLRELQETQARLIQTERLSAIGELAAAVAHQINNPVATIVLDSQLLLDRADIDEDMRSSLNAILRAGKRASTVVRRLLASARSDTDRNPPEPIDLVTTIEETVALVKSYIERDRIRVRVSPVEVPPPPVYVSRGELDDVWLNLLINAHDALVGRPGAQVGIDVHWREGDSQVEVVVWDNGPGVPEAIRDKIFKPFFTTKKVGEGTGIGLHICRQVVERAGGTIEVESQEEIGTRFIVRLPVMQGVLI
jgi:signal transduction histidine kinase/DNA-binding response OmpR family regulator